uniref:DH domain-containing protein n=1 Tax=Timema poppense TaxID=170557 RepID=A0A7R9D9T7_TIMPO|nr:unnamed protein product [Timema poppensis]
MVPVLPGKVSDDQHNEDNKEVINEENVDEITLPTPSVPVQDLVELSDQEEQDPAEDQVHSRPKRNRKLPIWIVNKRVGMELNCQTPQSHLTLSAELRSVIHERNILTTRSRIKVLSALDDLTNKSLDEKRKRMRHKAIHEILTSEANYLHHLELIMTYFMEPLKSKPFVSHTMYMTLFGNMETLYRVNGELLNELKQDTENVAGAFLKLAPFFKLYSVYAYDYRQAITLLQESQNNNAELNTFIENQESRPEVGAKLTSLLITPIQRVPRYCLLLREVLAHTAPSHPDYNVLQRSLSEVERVAKHINGLVQDYENMQKMLELQRSLCGNKPCLITPGRRFIKEGMLMKRLVNNGGQVSPHGSKAHPRYFVLFNDILIYCKLLRGTSTLPLGPNTLRCSCILPLKKCSVEEILSKGMFKVTCHHETIILYSSSTEEGSSWTAALKDAVKQYHECRQTLRRDSSSKRPVRGRDMLELNQDFVTPGSKRKRSPSRQNCVAEDDPAGTQRSDMWKVIRLNCMQGGSVKDATKSGEHSPESMKDILYPLRRSVRCQAASPSNTKAAPGVNLPASNVRENVVVSPSQETWHLRGFQLVHYLVSSLSRTIRKHVLRLQPTAPDFE